MSYSNIFSEKGMKGIGLDDLQSRNKDDNYSYIPRYALYASFNKGDFSRRKTTRTFQSVRLSVSDLLQRVEKQTENAAKLFPLIDKEKYQKRKTLSSKSSKVSVEDINAYYDSYNDRMQETVCTDPFEDMDVCSKWSDQHDTHKDGEPQQSGQSGNNELEKTQGIVTKGLSLPPRELQAECNFSTREKQDFSLVFGVRIEYMILSNTFKINVKGFGNHLSENGKKKFDILVAKVSMYPGNLQRQKIKIGNCEDTSLDKLNAYFRGISSPDLIRRELGVGIYLKQGFFRRPRVIYEWKISMENVDLIEPVTVWRKVDCRM